ncbi:unnamed protein product, partial [Closterium sp. NIES-54]
TNSIETLAVFTTAKPRTLTILLLDISRTSGISDVSPYRRREYSSDACNPIVTTTFEFRTLFGRDSGRLNIELHGYPKLNVYFVDLFHTLVNMPLKRFSAVLVAAYAALFVTFAIPFLAFARVDGLDCLPGVKRLDHAVWFTVQSSMSIGFGGDLTPHPDCFVVNFFVAVLSVVTLGFAYALLGVFYVKFSRPTRRAGTIKFSQYMVMYEELGQLRLSFRVADFRKHQIIS